MTICYLCDREMVKAIYALKGKGIRDRGGHSVKVLLQ